MQRNAKIFTLLMIAFVSACSTNMITTAASTVYNRRSLEKTINDQYVTMKIHQALKIKTRKFKEANIAIATYNGEVLLAGQVANASQKADAEKIVKQLSQQINGINVVYNLLAIASPASTLTKLSDSWITAKVKAKLIASEDVDASQIKVVTENGTVYLMGTLLPEDAQEAARIASVTDGVQQVVKIFSYIKISKRLA